MVQSILGPQLVSGPAIRDLTVDDITVVMPFYDRLKYLDHYLKEGFWDGLRVQIICDGSEPAMVENVEQLIALRDQMDIYSYVDNRGVAFARTTGINLVRTPYLAFCDDDDFMTEAQAFMIASVRQMDRNQDILFTAMPNVIAFNESLEHRVQYERTRFNGLTGLDVLNFLVQTGEMCVLSLGSVFRSDDLKGIGPEDFFKVSEDYVFVARLCARFPERQVKTGTMGRYWRLMQQDSLSAREGYSLDKIVMHLVSMFVGAYYLFKMGNMRTPFFQEILRRRGEVLKTSYGKGAEAALWMAKLLNDAEAVAHTEEEITAKDFLTSFREALPQEFRSLVGW